VPCNDLSLIVDQDWVTKAEALYAVRNLADLSL